MALLFADGVKKFLSPEVLGGASPMLAPLAMETIVNATGDLVQAVLKQLQEMGVVGK